MLKVWNRPGTAFYLPGKRLFHLSLECGKKDKYSLKNIGKSHGVSVRRSKSPSFKKYGGSYECPVTVYKLSGQSSESFGLKKRSRCKSMVENALQSAVESLVCSGDVDERLAGCPIELTEVDLSDNFSSAKIFWTLDPTPGNLSEAEVENLLRENIEFIRNILPAFHSMTHTPSVTFVRDDRANNEKLLEEAFSIIGPKQDVVK